MNTLTKRRLAKSIGVDHASFHVNESSGPGLPDDLAELEVPCCMGAAVGGLSRCTCWVPVYAETQIEPPYTGQTVETRSECCHDCAYRNGSSEREDGLGDELLDVAGDGSMFACHQGMRRVIAWRHPMIDGLVAAGDGDYRPPFVDGVAFLLDGTPAEMCAGWAAHRERLLR